MAKLLPSIHYPAAMAAAFSLFALLQTAGMPLVVRVRTCPCSSSRPSSRGSNVCCQTARNGVPRRVRLAPNLTFMVVVQLAWPPLVGFLFAYLLIGPARSLNLPFAGIWPHDWPVWLQAILMVLAVDFLRYWLHRAAHENETLWRLHSVHHSVEQLYWLNTARFHPIEKAMQMCLDSLPFLLMGVHEVVLALYYIAYATNGFFQHCNVRLHYGVLNYIVGSAETHRWHHSREPREANANYGNTVIVWDLLFGTWFLPNKREVVELGLREREYPKSFLGLMRAPFGRQNS